MKSKSGPSGQDSLLKRKHLPGHGNVWMLLVVDNLEIPGEFLSLDPLTADQRCAAVIFLVVIDTPDNGVHVGIGNGLAHGFFIQRAGPSQGIGQNFIAGVETQNSGARSQESE